MWMVAYILRIFFLSHCRCDCCWCNLQQYMTVCMNVLNSSLGNDCNSCSMASSFFSSSHFSFLLRCRQHYKKLWTSCSLESFISSCLGIVWMWNSWVPQWNIARKHFGTRHFANDNPQQNRKTPIILVMCDLTPRFARYECWSIVYSFHFLFFFLRHNWIGICFSTAFWVVIVVGEIICCEIRRCRQTPGIIERRHIIIQCCEMIDKVLGGQTTQTNSPLLWFTVRLLHWQMVYNIYLTLRWEQPIALSCWLLALQIHTHKHTRTWCRRSQGTKAINTKVEYGESFRETLDRTIQFMHSK